MESIKAIILAGGKGTRLRPLTYKTPKPLCKILNKPILGHLINKLETSGINKIYISAMYMSESIKEYIRSSNFKSEISIFEEESPLGSAGGSKYVFNKAECQKDDIIIILSGDGIFDFDLSEAIKFHINKKSKLTILTRKEKNPLEFGVILTDSQKRIIRIDEKPTWYQVRSDTINTGIYIISASIFDMIPCNRFYDFSKDLFPQMIIKKAGIYAYESSGYWCDVGNINAYFRCNNDALMEKINGITSEDRLNVCEMRERNIKFTMPCYISKSAKINERAVIGPYSIICSDVEIKGDSVIESSIIMDGVSISSSKISGSVVCENAVISDNCTILDGCIIGSNAVLNCNVIINENKIINPDIIIEEGTIVNRNIFTPTKNICSFNENSITCCNLQSREINNDIFTLGVAITNSLPEKNAKEISIAVINDGNDECKVAANLLLNLFSSYGITNYDFQSCGEVIAKHFSNEFMTDYFIYVFKESSFIRLKMYNSNGEYISREKESNIEKAIKNSDQGNICDSCYSGTTIFPNCELVYEKQIIKKIRDEFKTEKPLKNMKFSIVYKTGYTSLIFKNILKELGASISEKESSDGVKVEIAESGLDIKIIYQDGNNTDTFQILALLALVDEVCIKNKKVVSGIENDFNINYLIFKTITSSKDMCYNSLRFLSMINLKSNALVKAKSIIPNFEVIRRDIDSEIVVQNKSLILREIYRKYTNDISESHDGIDIKFEAGIVRIIPKNIEGFKIIANAASLETANDLSDMIINEIQDFCM